MELTATNCGCEPTFSIPRTLAQSVRDNGELRNRRVLLPVRTGFRATLTELCPARLGLHAEAPAFQKHLVLEIALARIADSVLGVHNSPYYSHPVTQRRQRKQDE